MWCSLTPVHRAPRRSSEEFPPVPFLNEGFGVEKQGIDRRGNCRETMVPLWRSKARALQSQPGTGESPRTLYPRSQRGAGSPSGGPGGSWGLRFLLATPAPRLSQARCPPALPSTPGLPSSPQAPLTHLQSRHQRQRAAHSALGRSDQTCHVQPRGLCPAQQQGHQSHRHEVKGTLQSCTAWWPWMSL